MGCSRLHGGNGRTGDAPLRILIVKHSLCLISAHGVTCVNRCYMIVLHNIHTNACIQVAQIRSRKGKDSASEGTAVADQRENAMAPVAVPEVAAVRPNPRTLTRTLTTKEINEHMAEGSGSVWTLSRSMSQSYLHKKAIRTMSR
jgi:hypothetical protein